MHYVINSWLIIFIYELGDGIEPSTPYTRVTESYLPNGRYASSADRKRTSFGALEEERRRECLADIAHTFIEKNCNHTES